MKFWLNLQDIMIESSAVNFNYSLTEDPLRFTQIIHLYYSRGISYQSDSLHISMSKSRKQKQKKNPNHNIKRLYEPPTYA